jgi:penicillin-binding protein 1A
MNGMYAPTGGNIDGGTYPADIWGEYMKKAVGKSCNSQFKKPTEPFQSQPFLGHYAREGGKDDENGKDGQTVDPSAPGVAPGTQGGNQDDSQRPKNGGDKKKPAGNDDANFDPNAYETPPQADPGGGTQAPPDDG